MLSCRPAHAARRSERAPGREPLVQRPDLASEREDLRPREVEPRPRHTRPMLLEGDQPIGESPTTTSSNQTVPALAWFQR